MRIPTKRCPELALVLALGLFAPALARAQESTPAAPESSVAPEAEVPAEEEEGPPITYDPQNRRDPFRPLTGESADRARMKYEGMLRGMLWQEAKLTAIVRTPKGNIATFEGGPKKEGFFAHVGDQFWNATVQDIDFTTQTVTIRERLDDPRLLKPYRDHPITLYSEEEMARQGGGAGEESEPEAEPEQPSQPPPPAP